MDQAAFLARVRDAARAGQAYRVATREIPPQAGYVGGGTDFCQRMADEVQEVGGQALVVHNLPQAAEAVQSLLDRYQAKSAFLWQHDLLDRLGITAVLADRGIVAHTCDSLSPLSRQQQRAAVLAADIGITSCSYAIAETGTLAMFSAPGRERMASLVPPVHVAIVEAAQILPDLFDLFARLLAGAANLPSNLTLITGPSKTGDIELQLTTGVHGPKHWHVIVVRDSP